MAESKKKSNQTYTGRRSVQGQVPDKYSATAIGQRIRYFRDKKGMEQKEIASHLGIVSNTICNWENGRGRPDIALLPKLCSILEISMDELFDMPAPCVQVEDDDNSDKAINDSIDALLLEKYHYLSDGHRSVIDAMLDKLGEIEDKELYDNIIEQTEFSKQLAAGFDAGVEFDDKGEPIYLYKDKVDGRADCIFTVSGDSMAPVYHSGDRVLVQRFPNCQELKPGDIGAFIVGNETYIKEYQKDGLHSFNEDYDTMHFNSDEHVILIGKVMGIVEEKDLASDEHIELYRVLHPEEDEE